MKRYIELLQHNIEYWYHKDQKMTDNDQEHVADLIISGYSSGELNDNENRGWWSITKED